jgi:hypothetical protein
VTGAPGIEVLEHAEELIAADRAGLLPTLARSGAQVRSVQEQTAGLVVDPPRAVLVTGPTARRDVALLSALVGAVSVPIIAVDAAGPETALPVWVGALDLVVVLAGERDDPLALEWAGQSRYRGAGLVVRGADSGPVADVAGAHLYPPAVGAPEVLAGAGRMALLLRIAERAGIAPAVDLDRLAVALDAEALASGPAAASFTNPASTLASRLWGFLPVLIGSDPVAGAVAERGATALGLLGATPAAAVAGSELARAPQLSVLLGAPVDPFADPFIDSSGATGEQARAVLLAPSRDAGDGATTLFRSLERAMPRALVVEDHDIPDDEGPSESIENPAAAALTARASSALRMALRLDFTAAYLGIAAGQIAPFDAPVGLASLGSAPPAARPATVEGMSGDEDRQGDGADESDPWGGPSWT